MPRIDADGTLTFGGTRVQATCGPRRPVRDVFALVRRKRVGARRARWRGDLQRARRRRRSTCASATTIVSSRRKAIGATCRSFRSCRSPRKCARVRSISTACLPPTASPPPLARVANALTQIVHVTICKTAANVPRHRYRVDGIDTLLLGGEPMNDVALGLNLQAERPPFVRLDTSMPGGGRFKLDGTIETGAAAAFNGDDRCDAWPTPIDWQAWGAPVASVPGVFTLQDPQKSSGARSVSRRSDFRAAT